MKLFIAALCTLVAITVFCTVGSIKSISIIDSIISELNSIPSDSGEIPENAKETSEKLLKMWDDEFFIISIFHPHQHLDEVKEKMTDLDSYSDTNEYAEWRQAHAGLEESLSHLKDLLKANVDNIM